MQDEYASKWAYRLKWTYLLLIVATLMSPVFHVMYISFNEKIVPGGWHSGHNQSFCSCLLPSYCGRSLEVPSLRR